MVYQRARESFKLIKQHTTHTIVLKEHITHHSYISSLVQAFPIFSRSYRNTVGTYQCGFSKGLMLLV